MRKDITESLLSCRKQSDFVRLAMFEICRVMNCRPTYAHFSKILGLRSSRAVGMVISGVRNASPRLLASLIEMLELSPEQAEHVQSLRVNAPRAGHQRESSISKESYLAKRKTRRQQLPVDASPDFPWYQYAQEINLILKKALGGGIGESIRSIISRPDCRSSPEQIRALIDQLEKVGLLVKQDGKHMLKGTIGPFDNSDLVDLLQSSISDGLSSPPLVRGILIRIREFELREALDRFLFDLTTSSQKVASLPEGESAPIVVRIGVFGRAVSKS